MRSLSTLRSTSALMTGILSETFAPPRMATNGCSGSPIDRKSTRLNSSHANISYAVFCLKKKNKKLVVLLFHSFYVLHIPFLSPTPITDSLVTTHYFLVPRPVNYPV